MGLSCSKILLLAQTVQSQVAFPSLIQSLADVASMLDWKGVWKTHRRFD